MEWNPRTGKQSHSTLDNLKATLFLVYAKQAKKKKRRSLLYCSRYKQLWPPRQSFPPVSVSMFSTPRYSHTDMHFYVHRLAIHVISSVTRYNAHPCSYILKKLLCIEKGPSFACFTTIQLKNSPQYRSLLCLFMSRSALYVSKYFYSTISCRISISYVVIKKRITKETQLNIVMISRYNERRAIEITAYRKM